MKKLLVANLNTIEADIIISKLKSYGIPVLKVKRRGELMEIYTGANMYRITFTYLQKWLSWPKNY